MIETIIKKLQDFIPTGDEAQDITRLYELTGELKKEENAHLACETLLSIFEKYPNDDLGSPGPIVHTLESFHEVYQEYLFRSLNRKPVYMTLWMFNRIINAEKDEALKAKYTEMMKAFSEHPNADDYAREEALEYYKYQTGE